MSTDPSDIRRSPPPVWVADDDDDGATRIEAFDPAKLEALAAAAAAAAAAARSAVRPPADSEVDADAIVDSVAVDADADPDAEDEGAKSLRADTILPVEIDEPSVPEPAPAPSLRRVNVEDESELTQASSFPPSPAMIPARPRVVSIPSRASRPAIEPAVIPPSAPRASVPAPSVSVPPLAEPAAAPDPVQASLARIEMDLEPPPVATESTPSPSASIQASLARIEMDLEPLGPPGSPAGFDAPAPAPAPAYAPPPSHAPAAAFGGPIHGRAPSMFENGPEPTQIGARPLISFGDTSPLTALVGERPQHVREAPAPQATFLPQPKPPLYKDRRVQLAAVVVVLLIVVILAVAL